MDLRWSPGIHLSHLHTADSAYIQNKNPPSLGDQPFDQYLLLRNILCAFLQEQQRRRSGRLHPRIRKHDRSEHDIRLAEKEDLLRAHLLHTFLADDPWMDDGTLLRNTQHLLQARTHPDDILRQRIRIIKRCRYDAPGGGRRRIIRRVDEYAPEAELVSGKPEHLAKLAGANNAHGLQVRKWSQSVSRGLSFASTVSVWVSR